MVAWPKAANDVSSPLHLNTAYEEPLQFAQIISDLWLAFTTTFT